MISGEDISKGSCAKRRVHEKKKEVTSQVKCILIT